MHIDPHARLTPRWSTASFGDEADTSPMELATLGEHLSLCQGPKGRIDGLQSAVRALQGLVASRFVTTLLLLSVISAMVMAL